MTVTGTLLLVAAAVFGAAVYRVDRQLRHLLPSRLTAHALPERLLARASLVDQIHVVLLQWVPRHWRRDLHAERGALLADRLVLFVGLHLSLAMAGLALLARAIAPAG